VYMTWTGSVYWGIPEYVEGSFVSISTDGSNWIPENMTRPTSAEFPPRYAWGCALSPSAEVAFAFGALNGTNQLPKIYIGLAGEPFWQEDDVFNDGYLIDKTIMAAS